MSLKKKVTKLFTIQLQIPSVHGKKLTQSFLLPHVAPLSLRQWLIKGPSVEHKRPASHWLSKVQDPPNGTKEAHVALFES